MNGQSLVTYWVKLASRLAAILAAGSWVTFIGLFQYYDATRPTTMQAQNGRILAQLDHGHIVYLSRAEQGRLDSLEQAALLFFLLTVCLAVTVTYRTRKSLDHEPMFVLKGRRQ